MQADLVSNDAFHRPFAARARATRDGTQKIRYPANLKTRGEGSRADMAAADDKQLKAVRGVANDVAQSMDLNAWLRLWDGSRVPLGKAPTSTLELKIAGPGVLRAILRKPVLDTIIKQYVEKGIDFDGGTLIELGREINKRNRSVKIKPFDTVKIAARLAPFFFAKETETKDAHGYGGDIIGRQQSARDNTAYISFHYDLSNEFYSLFLDDEMIYTCAYFTDWTNGIAQAQHDKLEMICRKLRLKPGERMLDIGSGWGGLLCHAARYHGVKAHGVTLSKEQLAFAEAKVKRLGLEGQVTFEFIDYIKLEGQFDKIASIGMYEAIGLENIPAYMHKVRSLLKDDGLFLNHAISRRAKRPRFFKERVRPEQRALAKYIFPGGALDDIGHTISEMELAGFEVHDVEGWRMHYARTTRLWCERLMARKDEAIKLVGEEKYRIFIAYLSGCSISFERGTARLFQTLCSKSAKGPTPVPPNRSDLYREWPSFPR
jgi:cyclopropane-fatty-acyl-phospholipid synthase